MTIGLFDLDSNQDKKLNINDSAFSLLQIWSDRNQDGYASAQELKTLSSLGIVSIDLDPAYIQTTTTNGKIDLRVISGCNSSNEEWRIAA